MPTLRKSSAAEEDLLNIYLYIGRRHQSPAAAEQLLVAIDKKCQKYAAYSEIGTARPDLGEDIRVFPCGTKSNPREWLVIYRPTKDGIEILRVFRGNQDYPDLF